MLSVTVKVDEHYWRHCQNVRVVSDRENGLLVTWYNPITKEYLNDKGKMVEITEVTA